MALRCATQSLLERWTQCQELDSIPGLFDEEYCEQELERVAMCVCVCVLLGRIARVGNMHSSGGGRVFRHGREFDSL